MLLAREARKTVAQARREGKKIIVLAGRPYHIDPEVNHALDKLICGLGAVVLGGLAISSIFTLTVVPLLMSLVIDFMSLFQRKSTASAEEVNSEAEPV